MASTHDDGLPPGASREDVIRFISTPQWEHDPTLKCRVCNQVQVFIDTTDRLGFGCLRCGEIYSGPRARFERLP